MTDADRLIEIETKLAFQERTIARLQEALLEQQKQMDKLRALTDRLRAKFALGPAEDPSDEPPPPHYFRSV
jgi:SlyX protein